MEKDKNGLRPKVDYVDDYKVVCDHGKKRIGKAARPTQDGAWEKAWDKVHELGWQRQEVWGSDDMEYWLKLPDAGFIGKKLQAAIIALNEIMIDNP
ncbi:MAG: hypothetical protein IIC13_19595, partial [SAR324 cluster bacterium]|nr:hypothetical protein [SAR324 cluster bacterium]